MHKHLYLNVNVILENGLCIDMHVITSLFYGELYSLAVLKLCRAFLSHS